MDSRVSVNLSIQENGEEYVVGSIYTNEYIEVPEEAVLIIQKLDGNLTLEEVSQWLKEEHNIDLDVLDFVNDLRELNFLETIDGIVLIEPKKKILRNNKLTLLISNLFFNKASNLIYIIIFLSTIYLILFYEGLFPSYKDILVFNQIGLSIFTIVLLTWTLTIIHEVGHFLAAYKIDIPVKFNLSIRMYWLVAEADISGLWSVPRNKRYVPFLAGMAFDSLVLFISVILKIAVPLLENIASLLVLLITIRFISHFMVFLRTDVYYVIMNSLNVRSLHTTSIEYIRNKFRFNKLPEMKSNERNYIRVYSFVYLAGAFLSLCMLAFYSVPSMILMIRKTIDQLASLTTFANFLDGCLAMIVIIVNISLWLFGAKQKLKTYKLSKEI
ncbi:PqqD family protein [Rossellomorea marisflavi]|uniref:PqqD family protein n=1 Tax=Rossellomorea marisflavi TaxID=189381 RepID=UPI00345DB583